MERGLFNRVNIIALEKNTEYRLEYGPNYYERFLLGETLGAFSVGQFSGYIDYQYTVW